MNRVLVYILTTVALGAQQPAAVQKVLQLFADLGAAQATKQKVRFRLSEDEANTYLQFSRVAHPRPGLDKMSVKFYPGNYISTYTVVDFDMVEAARPGTVPVVLKPVLSGKKEVWIDVRVRAENGFGTFSVEKAYFESIPLPAYLVEKMIYILGLRQPEKFDTSKPVPLPLWLRTVAVGEQFLAGEN